MVSTLRTSGGEHSSTTEISTDIFCVWQRAADSPLFCLVNASPHKGGRRRTLSSPSLGMKPKLSVLCPLLQTLSAPLKQFHTANGNRSRFCRTGGTSEHTLTLWMNPAATPISSVLLTVVGLAAGQAGASTCPARI